jgi:hypothetical protein
MNAISEVLNQSKNWKKSEDKILPVISLVTHVSLLLLCVRQSALTRLLSDPHREVAVLRSHLL